MPTLTAVTFQGFTPSDALRSAVQSHARHLDRTTGDIGSCLVTVKSSPLRRRKRFQVDIRISTHGSQVEYVRGLSRENPHDALTQAFDALEHRLEKQAAQPKPPRSYTPVYPVL